MGNRSMFVGLDVHKETVDIAVADGGRRGEVRHYGSIGGGVEALTRVVRTLRAPNRVLHFVYEAGPCGFGIHRHLTALGHHCTVVSPSMIPKRSGDHVNKGRPASTRIGKRKWPPLRASARGLPRWSPILSPEACCEA